MSRFMMPVVMAGMKRLVFAILFAMMAAGAAAWGQDCSNWTNNDLRGTYVGAGSGSSDASQLIPGMGFPSGLVPEINVFAFALDGRGGVTTGWAAINSGGTQLNFQLVGGKYSVQPDCSFQITFTWKIKELGVTYTVQHVGVWVPKPGSLELHFSLVGAPPGRPGPGFDLGVAYRISKGIGVTDSGVTIPVIPIRPAQKIVDEQVARAVCR
jgi:hypothetical protein